MRQSASSYSWASGHAVYASGGAASSTTRHRLGLLLTLSFVVLGVMLLAGPSAAHAASPQALILTDSVSVPGPPPAPAGESIEQYAAEQDGYTVTLVDGAQWDAMSAADFAKYQVVVIGDPTCGFDNFEAAVTNETTWEPVVMGSGGNKVIIGTDPTFHQYAHTNAYQLQKNGIAFAGAVGGATGAYVDLSCTYTGASPGTPVPLLDGLSSHGPGSFTAGGAPCAGAIAIVAASGPTAGLTDDDLSNWECSVHNFFDKWPADYTPLALATDPSVPVTYTGTDATTGATVSGSPYIMVSGSGVTVKSNLTLNPPSQTLATGSSASVVATLVNGSGVPISGASIEFDITGGPNSGKTFTGTTDGSGDTTFTYTGSGGPGTDSIVATYTSSSGVTSQGTASVTWTASAAPTTLTTSLSGSGKSGANITVPAGSSVSDSATLSGTNSSTAGGTVTYNVYSDSGCAMTAAPADKENVTNGSVANSSAVTLTTPGTYYWTASYSGDPNNGPSASTCGSETVTVTAVGKPPTVDDSCSGSGSSSVTNSGLDISQSNELVVAYVSADGPSSGGQSVTVSGSGLTWTKVASEGNGLGDAEVWIANAGTKKSISVTAKAKKSGLPIFLEDVSYKDATGIGANGVFWSASGAPSGSVTTTQNNSWVWGVGFDWLHATPRTVGAGQTLFAQHTDANDNTEWVQSTTAPTLAAGTSVTINDTAPTSDPFDLVVVEIL